MEYLKVAETRIEKDSRTAIAAIATADAVASVGVPTKAEFDAVVALANAEKAKINALIAELKSRGILTT